MKSLMHIARVIFLLGIIALPYATLVPAHAASAPPTILSYQGRLTNSSGDLLGSVGGTAYYFKFSIWNNATVGSGSRIWPSSAPTATSTTVRQGVFNVNIGDTANSYPDALNIDFSNYSSLYLQVEVSSDGVTYETLSPRQQITTSAYSAVSGAVVGTTTQSAVGTTTPYQSSALTLAATTSSATPLSIFGAASQSSNLLQIFNNSLSHLFSINSSGAIFASSTATSTFAGGLSANYLNLVGSSASSTFAGGLIINGGGLKISTLTTGSCDLKSDTSGNIYCGTDQTSAGQANPFTWDINYNVVSAATSSPLWAQAGVFASSTSHFATLDIATALSASSGGTGSTTLTGVLVGNGASALQTATISAPLSFSGSTLSITQAGTASNGYLSSADYTIFNNKISSSSLSQIFPFTPGTQYGLNTNATTTLLQLTNGLTASSTSHLTDFDFRNATGTTLAITGTTTLNSLSLTTALPNAQLANSSVTINTTGGLTGGGSLALGGTLNLGTFSWPYTPDLNYGALANSTSTPIWFKSGLQASSTSQIAYASSTALSISGATYFTNTKNAALSTDSNGLVVASTTGVVTAGTGISLDSSIRQIFGGSLAITNSGVTSNVAGNGISVSGATGAVTITNTIGYPFPNNATSTPLTISYASSTALSVSGTGYFGTASTTNFFASGLSACDTTTGKLLWTNGTFSCGTDFNTGGGGAFSWTPTTNYGALANSTSTPIWFGAGLQASSTSQIAYASSTAITVADLFGTNATTSSFAITGSATSTFSGGLIISGGGFKVSTLTSASCDIKSDTSGNIYCGIDATATGSQDPFVFSSNYASVVAATSSITWFQNGLQASSTSQLAYASTTALTAATLYSTTASTSNLTVSLLPATVLSTNGSGVAQATTISAPLSFSGSTLSITQAGTASNGYLSSADYTIFNNKISSSSLSQIFPFTPTTNYGALANSTSTPIFFSSGLQASSTSNFVYASSTALTVSGSLFGANLSTCNTTADKLLWGNGVFSCGTDSGASGSDVNWTHFNGSGIRVTTATDQVLIGFTSTSTLSNLEVIGGATIDNATTTNFYSTNITANTKLGIGTSSPSAKLTLSGGTFYQEASSSPTLAATVTTANNTYATAISGRYAYVAEDAGGLRIIDISEPKSPVIVGSYSLGGAKTVAVAGRYAYVGDTSTGLNIIDVSNPVAPTLVGTYSMAGTFGLALSGKYAFVSDFSNAAVRIIDVSNPASPVLAGSVSVATSKPYGLAVSGKYLYIADQWNSKIYIVDISNPAAPARLGTYTGTGGPSALYASGKYLYVGDDGGGFYILDVSNPNATPAVVGTYNTTGSYYGVQVAGNYVYLSDHTGTTTILDIHASTTPKLVGHLVTGGTPWGITVAGKYAYVAAHASGLKVIDLNGADLPLANIGAISSNNINVSEDLAVGNNITAGGGLSVGISGIFSRGTISAYVASSTQTNPTVANFMGGNVGIGTTSPYAALSVAGQSVFNYITATGTLASTLPFASSTALTATNLFFTNATSTGSLAVTGSSTVSSVLNVGGTLNANGALTVTGATTLASSLTGLAYTSSGAVSAITNGTLGSTGVLGISGGVPAYVATSTLFGAGGIPNSALANSSLTVNGTSISLGSSGTITAASSTLLANDNTWSGVNTFAGATFTSATTSALSVSASSTIAGVFNAVGGANFGTASYSAAITSTATGANTFPYASSTALSVSGTGYFGTASTSNLTVSLLPASVLSTNATGGVQLTTISAPLSFSGSTLAFSPSADVSFNSNKITSLTDPTLAQDAATKNYVDVTFGGGVQWKQSVRLATAAALPTNVYANGVSGVGATLTATSNGALSIDGTAVVAGNRVLIKDEATTANNGIYTVTQAGSGALPYILTRATDYDQASEMAAGDTVAATAGATNIDTFWLQTTNVTTVGTDAVSFSQFAINFTAIANSWGALQSFANASTSLLSVTGKAYFGGTATSTFDSAGNLTVASTASTSNLRISGTQTFEGLTSGSLAVNASGAVYKAATTTFGGGLTYAGGNVTLDWLFPSNATTTSLAFNGGLTATSATFTAATTSALSVSASSTIAGVLNAVGGANFGTASYSAAITSTATAANTFPYASSTALSVSGTGYFGTASTSNLTISSISSGSLLKTTTGGAIIAAVAGTDYVAGSSFFSYPFALTGNATSTLTQFNGGLTAYASSTIGNGTQIEGLTISGGSTTTLNAYFASNVGIGTTSPWAQLSINPNGITGPAFAIGSTTSTYFVVNNAGLTGIGTSSPFARLSVQNTVSAPQAVIAYDNATYTQLRTDATGDLWLEPSGNDLYMNNDNFWVCTGGSISTNGCPSGMPTGQGNIIVENKLGIGTTTLGTAGANYKLAIETQDTTTAFLNIASSTANWSSTTNLFTIGANGKVGIGSSTPFARLAIGANGAITTTENKLATSTSMTISWIDGNQQLVQIGTAATTISFSNYISGQILRLVVCNPGGTAGALTFSGVEWTSATVPTQTTTASYCDLYTFIATQATSTTGAVKIFGAAATGFN